MFSKRLVSLLVDLALVGPVFTTVVTNDTSLAANGTFDYVVVGGGLTGITVGNKLSGEGYSVLIIEAGPDARWNPDIYNAEGRSYPLHSYCNYKYPAYNDDGKELWWKIDNGACIGGSTSSGLTTKEVNGMVWYRPTETEVDKLETLGNPGWNWNSLMPSQYMEAIERNIPPDTIQTAQGATFEPSVHGYNGVINTSFTTPIRIPTASRLYKEALPLTFPGLVVSSDLSRRTSTVSASTSWTIWYDPVTGQNRRSSAADGLLWAQEQQRDHLTVLANHKVARVLFDDKLAAIGVTFLANDNSTRDDVVLHSVFAGKEVILAAGSLASPAVLERSGVGRRDVLEAAGIEQLVDLPGVGSNLCEQPGTSTSALVTEAYQNDTSLINNPHTFGPVISLINLDQIWGAEASTQMDEVGSSQNLLERAESLVAAGAATSVEGATKTLNITIDLIVNSKFPVVEFIGESYPKTLSTIFWPLLPLSRGHLHIATPDPLHHPVITPRLLTDAFDQSVAVAVARRSRDLFQSPPFAGVVADAYYDPKIGADGTDAEYLAFVRDTSYGASHWFGSTSMMPREWGGVVDARLGVYGTKKLRVVDAGIMPFQITSHPMSMLYAVAQKAADLILADA